MRSSAILLAACLLQSAVADETIVVAVASNFSRTATELSERFTDETGIVTRISHGSTGKLYAQILNGAPFDVFLAADAERPAMLERSGLAVTGSRFTYAQGALVLWSRSESDCIGTLRDEAGGRIALANPVTAPYGKAALEFLTHEGYWKSVSGRAVYGESITQTLHFVATGNASIGVIAKSQLYAPQLPETTCAWEIPDGSYSGIEQQAVLLNRAADNESAVRFAEFLQSGQAREIIRRHGYGVSP